jgi:tyrosyl-tRNA synthetase
MSKSLGNYVGINEAPAEMFGKLMSISDEMMWRYYLLLTDLTPAAIDELKASVASGKDHPLAVKKALARRIIADFHSALQAGAAQSDFEAQFQAKGIPSELPPRFYMGTSPVKIGRFLVELALAASGAEAQRKIKEGAVSMAIGDLSAPNWQRVTNPALELKPLGHGDAAIRVGRQVCKVIFPRE